MFNPVHHHCHFFMDFYKNSEGLNLNHFLLFGKSDNLYPLEGLFLIVPAGFDPRP